MASIEVAKIKRESTLLQKRREWKEKSRGNDRRVEVMVFDTGSYINWIGNLYSLRSCFLIILVSPDDKGSWTLRWFVDHRSVTKHPNLVIAASDTAILLLVALSLSSGMDINYFSRDRRLIDFTMHASNTVTKSAV